MDVSLSEVWLWNWRSSEEEQNAVDSARTRLFSFVDPGSRSIVAAVVSNNMPDEQTIVRLLPSSGEEHRESEDARGDQ